MKPYEKKSREQSSRTVTWQSADFQTKFVRLSNQVGDDATVGRLSNNCFPRYQAIGRIFEKSRWTVTREWSEVTRLSADCQTTFSRRFKQLEIFLKKVAERSRDSGRRSRDRRPTVKQRFLDVPIDLGKFWKKSLNGHVTVVEVTPPSADYQTTFFGRFKRFGKILKKVAERSRNSGRRSRDHRTTFFRRFKQLEKILKKVAERSRDSSRRSRDRRPTVKQRFWMFQAIRKFFQISHWTVTRQWSEVTRLSADCQTTIFSTFQAIRNFFEKSRWTVTRQWSEVTQPSADCQATFLDVLSN